MKRGILILTLLLALSVVSAEACDFDATLLNQDPYPAVPGDYVKLVFQLDGLDASECKDISFKLLDDYPLEFNPGESGLRIFSEVDYIRNYDSSILIPFKVRINGDALDGTTPIEALIQNKGNAPLLFSFDLEVEDVRADFEISIKNYDYNTNELTLEILNIEDSDVDALTLEIPPQENIKIKGAPRVIVGDLDSNEYTTADFEAIPSDGEFTINLIYSDTINIRRTISKTVEFDSEYFKNRKSDESNTSIWTYIFWIALIAVVVWWFYRRSKKKKKK